MTKVFTDVATFMLAGEQTVGEDNTQQAELYLNLIKEEYQELLDARQLTDDVLTIDACFDTIWVIVGYMLSRGWSCERIWDEGALSNLRKIDRKTQKILKREDGKILKPEGWQPPDFTKFINK
jgi:predicted HAD superfamily Cof-like phosphohydrolase